jgi:uncharacterized protein
MKRMLLPLLFALLSIPTIAQQPDSIQRDAIKKLSWLVGQWNGESWGEHDPGHGAYLTAPAAAERNEDVTWTNGDVRLEGTLHLPDGKAPYAAFVILHGAGAEDRSAFTARRYVDQFVKHGIAVLHYDKRGAGKSTGDWMASAYSDLAKDAVAGIELLAARPDIDKRTIGVIGFSEGGWTGPLAASLSPHVSLLILVSGPPMSPFEQELYASGVELRNKGASDADIAEAAKLSRLRWRTVKTDQGWDELDKAISEAQSKSWYKKAGSPGPPDKNQPRVRWYARIMDYDPIPVLKKLTIPALMMYGADDPKVDGRESGEIMRRLAKDENKDFTVHVYPKVGHNLTAGGFRFPDDHWTRIFGWIEEKGAKR